MSERMRRAAAWPIALVFVGAAYLVSATVPADEVLEAPFATTGEVGDRLVGRTADVRLVEVLLADELEAGTWRGTTAGRWVVAQLVAAGVSRQTNLVAELEIDGSVFAATERTDDVVTDRLLDVMLPVHGSAAIEVPTAVLESPAAEHAILRFSQRGDVRLDSVLEYPLDLTALPSRDRVRLDPPGTVTW